MSLRIEMNSLVQNLGGMNSRLDAALDMFTDNAALKLQNYARDKARWTDRTGHARQRLTGYKGKIANGYRIYLAHGVSYGIWLEYAHERKYAILEETIQTVGSSEIMPGFNRLIERLGT